MLIVRSVLWCDDLTAKARKTTLDPNASLCRTLLQKKYLQPEGLIKLLHHAEEIINRRLRGQGTRIGGEGEGEREREIHRESEGEGEERRG